MTNPLSDREDRRNAVLTPNHAFVWASAGTGKTHTLTLRALYLLLHNQERALYTANRRDNRLSAATRVLQSIALTTFTRKASAEMKTRLYEYLDAIVSHSDTDALSATAPARKDPLFLEIVDSAVERSPLKDYERFRLGVEALAERASELQISTIHSFAASILRRHPLEAGIPPHARFARDEDDEDEVQSVTGQLIQRWWESRAGRNPDLQLHLSRVLEVVNVSQIRTWFGEIHENPWISQELASMTDGEASASRFKEALTGIIEGLRSISFAKISRCRQWLETALETVSKGDPEGWRMLCDFAEAHRNYFFLSTGKPPKSLQESINSLSEAHRQYFQDARFFYLQAVRLYLREAHAERWHSWCHLMTDFAGWAPTAAMEEMGLVTFDDMIRLANQLLRNFPEVRTQERLRLRALLVDEFQDTDPQQLELLAALLGGDDGDTHDVMGFFVGDPKQSIYRFRGADVTSIEEFRRRYGRDIRPVSPVEEFQLVTSFRSVSTITTFVNTFFSDQIRLTPPREHLHPFRTDQSTLPQWLVLTAQDGKLLGAQESRKLMTEATVQLIVDHVDDDGSFSDILVLVRKASELDVLLPALHEAGIPVIATGARTFYRHHEVLDVLNLLIALHHPGDTLAVAGVLRSPLVLASDDEIHRLFRVIPPSGLLSGSDELPEFLSSAPMSRITCLRTLFRSRMKLPHRDWLREVQAFMPANSYVAPDDPEGRALARIQRTFESFRQVTEEGVFPPISWLIRQRTRAAEGDRRDGNLGEDVSLADETVDAVRAMTIHKAKGLESSVVIGYGWVSVLEEVLGRDSRFAEPVIRTRNEAGELVRGFSLPWGPITLTSPGYWESNNEEERGSCEEGERLAYVAATRARDRLILLSPCRRSVANQSLNELNTRCLQGLTEDWVDLKQWHPRETRASTAGPSSLLLDRDTYEPIWLERQSQLERWESPLLLRPSSGDLPHTETYDLPAGQKSSLVTGRLVHSYLERWVTETSFSAERFQFLWQEVVETGEILESRSLQRAREILQCFYSGELRDHRHESYCDRIRRARIAGRELPVFLVVDGARWNGILDLVLEEEGRMAAVDYKTSASLDPLPQSYQQQEEIYREVLKKLFPDRSVSFEFWWLGQKSEPARREQRMLPFTPVGEDP